MLKLRSDQTDSVRTRDNLARRQLVRLNCLSFTGHLTTIPLQRTAAASDARQIQGSEYRRGQAACGGGGHRIPTETVLRQFASANNAPQTQTPPGAGLCLLRRARATSACVDAILP